jgi:hypothetical protein
MRLVFRDNFFNSGRTEILDEEGKPAGELDLKSAFGSATDVYDARGGLVCSGKFAFFSNRWVISAPTGDELGVLRHRMSFASKRYEYDARRRGIFEITSPAFSREYEIRNEAGEPVANFDKVDGWFETGAFALDNRCIKLSNHELVAVIMGMHEIMKRHQ